jgi:phage shock protein E
MKSNLGTADRLIRVIIAIAASALYFTHTVTGVAGIVLLVAGGILLLTAVINFCPLYSLLRISTNIKVRTDYEGLMFKGAVIVDVRSAKEYAQGHIKNSINIPLEKIGDNMGDFKNKTVITCCQSGYRSQMAKVLLAKNGIDVYDGGAWSQLDRCLNPA